MSGVKHLALSLWVQALSKLCLIDKNLEMIADYLQSDGIFSNVMSYQFAETEINNCLGNWFLIYWSVTGLTYVI